MARHSDRLSVRLFWGLPVLSGIGITLLLLGAGRNAPGTIAFIGLIALVIVPPTVVGVDARRRGIPSTRVSAVVAKNLLLMLLVCVLALIVALSIALPDAWPVDI